jgi:hypothetical protein
MFFLLRMSFLFSNNLRDLSLLYTFFSFVSGLLDHLVKFPFLRFAG